MDFTSLLQIFELGCTNWKKGFKYDNWVKHLLTYQI